MRHLALLIGRRYRRRDKGEGRIVGMSGVIRHNLRKLLVRDIEDVRLRATRVSLELTWVEHIHVRGSLGL